MNCEQFNDRLADLLGGELDATQHAEARRHMETCARCRDSARGLQAAAAALEAHLPSQAEAEHRTRALSLPREPEATTTMRRPAGAWAYAALRYAAVITLAFGAGHAYRNASTTDNGIASQVEEPAPKPDFGLTERYARRTNEFPAASSFSRALMALAKQ